MMEFTGREHTQIRKPVPPPIGLEAGRLDIKRAVLSGLFVLASLLLALGGAWLGVRSASGYGGVSWPGMLAGLAVAAVSVMFGGTVTYVMLGEWLAYQRRVEQWHQMALNVYRQHGAETVEQVTEWNMSVENPAHLLIVALWLHRRAAEGQETPWSIRSMRGPIFLNGRRVGDIGKTEAERIGQKLGKLGLITGRQEGTAGTWACSSYDEVVTRILQSK